jgi:hypothetical protein
MAVPQRQEPEPRRDYGTLPPERPVRSTSVGFAWWWVLWLIIIGLFIWWAGWGWGGTGGWWRGTREGYAGNGAAGAAYAPGAAGTAAGATGNGDAGRMSGPGKQVLDATNKSAFINQNFQVNDAPVQGKINNRALWIGASDSSRMLAVLNRTGSSAANADISQGTLVNVTGTVEKAPPAAQLRSQWHLSRSDAQRVEQQGVYIQASQVTNAQP